MLFGPVEQWALIDYIAQGRHVVVWYHMKTNCQKISEENCFMLIEDFQHKSALRYTNVAKRYIARSGNSRRRARRGKRSERSADN
jgi:hypothetical protein